MMQQTSKASSASEALDQLLSFKPAPVVNKNKPMICTNNLKRSRSGLASFDMSAFEVASEQVEESIAFPSIEWSFDDSEDDETDAASFPSAKRRCSGLTRSSQASFDLSSFSERRGSNGSLC
eukprot:CAMPEP_0117029714 /NCGR_PEP_ID=MMETSP0472-20121206/21492_1 /TAXON_ID=693140 ORGANISM="Tiarina fusus, Strain LIS" /NCGR_SAMPLE_ID=MMETSP0472 /ASSEMBLY_ACC=CAM_ASM_000603 /LENGTH=121 /DNA_ID=CAMNT_0004737555 /DNA_START=32 /DNA_END=397 /DNA_ORIENTATION=-